MEAVKRLFKLEMCVDSGVGIQLIREFGICLVRLKEMQS